jgi:uncharacterized membrane protein YfcA
VIVVLVALGLLIGLTLGALGAGGSILAVPVLVHVGGLTAAAATATSLVAVGSAASMAAIGHRRQVRLDVALWFVPTGVVGALLGSRVGKHVSDDALLLAFSALLVIAGYRMLTMRRAAPRSLSAATHQRFAFRRQRADVVARSSSQGARRTGRALTIAAAGIGVGFLTGLFGVGGGFVIVPALTLAVGLAMPEAIATSLVVIAANTVIALAVRGVDAVDWPVAAALTAPMLAGGFVGAGLGRRIDGDIARVTFAVLLLVVAVLNAIVVVT